MNFAQEEEKQWLEGTEKAMVLPYPSTRRFQNKGGLPLGGFTSYSISWLSRWLIELVIYLQK